jgi:hypothetical protein
MGQQVYRNAVSVKCDPVCESSLQDRPKCIYECFDAATSCFQQLDISVCHTVLLQHHAFSSWTFQCATPYCCNIMLSAVGHFSVPHHIAATSCFQQLHISVCHTLLLQYPYHCDLHIGSLFLIFSLKIPFLAKVALKLTEFSCGTWRIVLKRVTVPHSSYLLCFHDYLI